MKEKVTAGMAGNLWKTLIKVGDIVEEGQDMFILESMKMEIPIAATKKGEIIEILVSDGDFINENQPLAILK